MTVTTASGSNTKTFLSYYCTETETTAEGVTVECAVQWEGHWLHSFDFLPDRECPTCHEMVFEMGHWGMPTREWLCSNCETIFGDGFIHRPAEPGDSVWCRKPDGEC